MHLTFVFMPVALFYFCCIYLPVRENNAYIKPVRGAKNVGDPWCKTLLKYYCRTKIHKFDPSTSPLCNRCKISEGTLAHTLWSCTKLSSYWFDIFQCFSKAFKKNLKPDPLVAILGGTGALLLANTYEAQAVSLGMGVAKNDS